MSALLSNADGTMKLRCHRHSCRQLPRWSNPFAFSQIALLVLVRAPVQAGHVDSHVGHLGSHLGQLTDGLYMVLPSVCSPSSSSSCLSCALLNTLVTVRGIQQRMSCSNPIMAPAHAIPPAGKGLECS
jgi:hypothetical protein